jgi:hypothetical protein
MRVPYFVNQFKRGRGLEAKGDHFAAQNVGAIVAAEALSSYIAARHVIFQGRSCAFERCGGVQLFDGSGDLVGLCGDDFCDPCRYILYDTFVRPLIISSFYGRRRN